VCHGRRGCPATLLLPSHTVAGQPHCGFATTVLLCRNTVALPQRGFAATLWLCRNTAGRRVGVAAVVGLPCDRTGQGLRRRLDVGTAAAASVTFRGLCRRPVAGSPPSEAGVGTTPASKSSHTGGIGGGIGGAAGRRRRHGPGSPASWAAAAVAARGLRLPAPRPRSNAGTAAARAVLAAPCAIAQARVASA